MRGSAEWKPKARWLMRRILLLRPSRRPLVRPRWMAARMPSRCSRRVRASRAKGLGLERDAQASQASRCSGARAGSSRWYRHGTDDGEVTLGGRRVAVKRPRMRTKDGTAEVPPASYEHFASRDALSAAVMERMLAAVSNAATGELGSRSARKWR